MSEQGIYLHLASVGSHNYGHWLTDDLPRLKAFHALRHLYPRRTITIVMPSYNVTIDEVRLRTIRLYLGWDADWHVIFLHRDKVYSFPRLFHVTPCSQQPVAKSPDALDTVRKRMRQATSRIRRTALIERAKASPLALFRGAGRQVFIDRAEFRGRAIVNREEVLAIVLKRGFEVIDPEGMEPSEQVARFAAADFIVGIMGAAMTNTIFSRPGTRVVHLAPDAGWSDPFFWDLAAVCGHRYAVVYGRYDTAEGPDRLRNFIVDADRVEAALQAV